jgi:hypothetical protein
MTKHAFKCNTCGHLATSDEAGERDFPAACTTCGAGVAFTPAGIKTYNDDNWTVLADLPEGELAKLPQKLSRKDVAKHTPAPVSDPDHVPQNISRETAETLIVEDRTS